MAGPKPGLMHYLPSVGIIHIFLHWSRLPALAGVKSQLVAFHVIEMSVRFPVLAASVELAINVLSEVGAYEPRCFAPH